MKKFLWLYISFYINNFNDRVGSDVRASDFYSSCARFESRIGHKLSRLRLSLLLSAYPGQRRDGYEDFLPYPLRSIVQYSVIIRRCTVLVAEK
jgi:hypothetical protein